MAKRINWYDYNNKNLDFLPIRKGCEAEMCACLGVCEEIVGYVPRKDYEDFDKSTVSATDEFLSKYIKKI